MDKTQKKVEQRQTNNQLLPLPAVGRLASSSSGPVERGDRPIIRNLAGMRPDHPIR
jgi:hypothetical protein